MWRRFMGPSNKRVGLADASLFSIATFSWAGELIRTANSRSVTLEDADYLPTPQDNAVKLAQDFDEEYARQKSQYPHSKGNRTFRVLVSLYTRSLILHSLWTLSEIGFRLAGPVALRFFLIYLSDYSKGVAGPQWQGWLLALALSGTALGMTLIHHPQFWVGMRMGLSMRQQCISAVHAKALRLTGPAISAVNSGRVVNMVSNDVRRFDDAMPFWVFLWAGPLELGMVMLMIALELGILPALAGVAVTLLLIPVQAILVRPVANIRKQTAACTDERVRLAGEAINGALAMKMLSWEKPIANALRKLRAAEASHIRHMAYIKACNLALQFAVTPLVAFATFSVARAVHGELDVPKVFYALSLLNLPKLYMIQFFVTGIQNCTELSVSLKRIDTFLQQTELPTPVQYSYSNDTHKGKEGMRVVPESSSLEGSSLASPSLRGAVACGHPRGYVAMRGADYTWAQPFGDERVLPIALEEAPKSKLKPQASTQALSGKEAATVRSNHPQAATLADINPQASSRAVSRQATGLSGKEVGATLTGIKFELQPGTLIGICGEVGSGKSSLLMALLGDLQPLLAQGGSAGEGVHVTSLSSSQGAAGSVQPHVAVYMNELGGTSANSGAVMCGSISYCSQIPWIVAGTVKDNILFGKSFEEEFYNKVLVACALVTDIESLANGDETELGERGINLSGGQKARIALARSVYSRSSIHLLDDPLSAVDPRVGRTLFDKAIGPEGLMKGSTRVLVTHQRQFLPRCDVVMVLQKGRIEAMGSPQDLSRLNLTEMMADVGGEVSMDELADNTEAAKKLAEATKKLPGATGAPVAGTRLAVGSCEVAGVSSDSASSSSHSDSGGLAKEHGVGGAAMADTGAVILGSPLPGAKLAKPTAAAAHDLEGGDGGVADGLGKKASYFGKSPSFAKIGSFFGQSPSFGQSGSKGGKGASSFATAPSFGKSNSFAKKFALSGSRSFAFLTQQGRKALGRSNSVLVDGALPEGSEGGEEKEEEGIGNNKKGQLVKVEGMEKGSVSLIVYWRYCQQLGSIISLILGLALIGGQAVYCACDWWLALWARADKESQLDMEWIWVYGMLTAMVLVFAFGRAFLFFDSTVRAATRIHDCMAHRVVRAPLSFFHTNPAGRILNRFSKDLGMVDDLLPTVLFDFFQTFFLVLSAFVLVSIAVPVILPVFIPLALFFYYLRQRYVTCSREVKRWEAVTRSPVFAFFSASLKGLSTIRAYAAQGRFQDAFLSALQETGIWSFAFFCTARWIGFRLDLIATTTLFAASLLAMVMRDSVSVALLGLALAYVLQLTGLMQWMVRQSAEVENNMTALERLLDYTRLEQEPPNVGEKGGNAPPVGWPSSGALAYEGVSATYRPGLPPVLVDISFTLAGGSSCGVVGRTGSGKSSLMLTLFRLIEVSEGTIRLDGLDVSTIGLDALRRQLAIIPQDPVLFSGTLRSNLDPWDMHPDSKLWEVLDAVKLKDTIEASGGLHNLMQEGGDNLSVGQRQLFCLARALLQNARVLALDEATANVDRGTDALIQDALSDFAHQEPSAGRLLMVIAHRIDTIMDCDNLLVLNAGKLMENGSPAELASKKGGLFSSMVQAAKVAGH